MAAMAPGKRKDSQKMSNMFNLKKDLIFFDLEATGLSVVRDRIVQIGMVKYSPGKEEPEQYESLVNPEMVLISPEAYEVHGISAQDVANKPTFAQLADEVLEFIGDGDLAGYNSDRFDVPLLMEEFTRVGKKLDMSVRRTIDVQRIFYKMEPRTLAAAYRFYCQKEMENAHDAIADVKATAEVLMGQIEMYKDKDYVDKDDQVISNPIKNDVEALSSFTSDLRFLDATQKIKVNEQGVPVFNFGKYMNQPVAPALAKDRNYYHWILEKEFSTQVKDLVKRLLKEYESQQNSTLFP